MLVHGVGVPLGLAVGVVLGTPAFLVGLLHVGVKIDAAGVLAIAARAVATAGLVLGGLAPLAALVLVSSEEAWGAAVFAWIALLSAGALALRSLGRGIRELLGTAPSERRFAGYAIALAFALVTALLAVRVWTMTLPVLSPWPTATAVEAGRPA
jgi:hypothetical protein